MEWKRRDGDPTWLGGDRWKIRVYAGIDRAGKQRQRSATFRAPGIEAARKQAAVHRGRILRELEEGRAPQGSVAELADEWVEFKAATRWEQTTEYANRVMVKQIKDGIGKKPLDKLTARDLDRFYGQLLEAGKSPSTVNHYHRLIHSMIRQGMKWGKVAQNVASLATPPRKVQDGDHRLPTHEAVRAVIAKCPPSLRMAALLAAATGARRGEIVGLLWSDIRGNQLTIRRALVKVPKGTLSAKSPKSGKARTITLDDETMGALLDHHMWLAAQCHHRKGSIAADGPIIAKISGRNVADRNARSPYPPGWVTQEWADVCDIPGFRFHDLRHAHASWLIEAGIPLSMISPRLGHSKISTTSDIYVHQLRPTDQVAADAIGPIIHKKEPASTVAVFK